jgi:hypothetical protein
LKKYGCETISSVSGDASALSSHFALVKQALPHARSGSTYTTDVPSAATNAALKALNSGFTSYNQRSG